MVHHNHNHMNAHRHTKREGAIDIAQLAQTTTEMVQEATRARLVPRASCTNDTDEGCVKPTQTPTLFIVLAVTLPVVIAAVVLIVLHRRSIKKLAAEDREDKYKSLDFGVPTPRNGKKGPEMKLSDVEKSHGRGLSLGPDLSSPYLLPAGLHSSRESFHSLSRSTKDSYDPYGPVTFGGDDASIRSGSRAGRDGNESVYSASTRTSDKMKNSLLKNAQRMSESVPLGASSSPERATEKSIPEIRYPEQAATPLSPLNPRFADPFPSAPAPSIKADDVVEQPASAYVAYAPPSAANPPPAPAPPVQDNKARATTTPSPPPRVKSHNALVMESNTMSMLSESSYGEGFQITPPSPRESQTEPPAPLAPQPRRPVSIVQNGGNSALAVDGAERNTNRLSMSLRPLPPANEDPNEDPEQRANRIRSFYKEYFDDSKPEPAGTQIYNDYYEDYTSEYLDGSVFDPQTGNFIVAQPTAPFAQPVTRRAMTPPPRAPPRFRSNTNGSARGLGPHMSQGSMGSGFLPPRNMTSMSGRAPAPRKPLAPPTPLSSLPTPGKLQDDFGIFNAADFAPPVSIRDLQNGKRPDSPLGASRPYSPSVMPHTPLATTLDELAPMPSPHLLRNSSTFTALDFAPPPKFHDPYGPSNGSDAGSIRSNRSGISNTARMAVRNGAYRVSRIPKEMVGTQDDMAISLRPTLDMVRHA